MVVCSQSSKAAAFDRASQELRLLWLTLRKKGFPWSVPAPDRRPDMPTIQKAERGLRTKIGGWSDGMAQGLRALAALGKDPGSVPRIHTVARSHLKLQFQGSDPLF